MDSSQTVSFMALVLIVAAILLVVWFTLGLSIRRFLTHLWRSPEFSLMLFLLSTLIIGATGIVIGGAVFATIVITSLFDFTPVAFCLSTLVVAIYWYTLWRLTKSVDKVIYPPGSLSGAIVRVLKRHSSSS